ncbi:MAG: hypothetical protein LBB14_02295 [Puniceicoccales bacterium]|jgi:hypothetical protein|nr:hypothetical protein [Puniceicoccales bacterium]
MGAYVDGVDWLRDVSTPPSVEEPETVQKPRRDGLARLWDGLVEDLFSGNIGELQVAVFALMRCAAGLSSADKNFSQEKIRETLLRYADFLGDGPARSPEEREERANGLVRFARDSKNNCSDVICDDRAQRNVLAYARSLIPQFSGGLSELNAIVETFLWKHFPSDGALLDGFLLTRFPKREVGIEGRIWAYTDPVGRLRLITGGDFGTNCRKQQLFLRLNRFLSHRDADGLLKSISDCAISRKGQLPPLSIFCKDLTSNELVLLALDTAIGTPVRQRPMEGSCFATAPVGNAQSNDPLALVRLFEQIVRLGGIEVEMPSDPKNSILVPCNCYEDKWEKGTSNAEIMQYAIVRTVADAAPFYDSRYYRDPQTIFPQEVNAINDLLQSGEFSANRRLIYEEPRYDSSVAADGINGAPEEKGARVHHIGLEGEKLLRPANSPAALREFIGEVERFIEKIPADTEASLVRKKKLEEAVKKIRALPNIFTGAGRPWRGAMGGVPVPGQKELDPCPMPPVLKRPRDAEDLFRGWFEILDKYSAVEAPKVLVWGEGHVYNLSPEFSQMVMEALHSPGTAQERANRLMDLVRKSGKPLLFIDPNWKGVCGVGLCHCGGNKLELFLQREDGYGLRIRPQHPIFYRNLCAFV